MRTLVSVLIVAAGVTLACAASASAGLIAYDGFDYTAETSVGGQTGGTGWAGAWTVSSGGAVTVKSPGLTFGDLVSEGNKVYVDVQTANLQAVRAVPTALSANGTTTYISYIANWMEGTRYFGLQLLLGTTGTTESGYFGKNSGAANWRFSGPITLDSGVLVTTAPTLLVLRIDQIAGSGNDRVSLFVNPTPGQPEPTPNATATGNVNTFQRIGLSGGFNLSGNTTSSGYMDEVRIGTTWESVTPIPEPSTWLLLASGVLSVLLVKCRRRR